MRDLHTVTDGDTFKGDLRENNILICILKKIYVLKEVGSALWEGQLLIMG